jgi:hypothetical protein
VTVGRYGRVDQCSIDTRRDRGGEKDCIWKSEICTESRRVGFGTLIPYCQPRSPTRQHVLYLVHFEQRMIIVYRCLRAGSKLLTNGNANGSPARPVVLLPDSWPADGAEIVCNNWRGERKDRSGCPGLRSASPATPCAW